MNTSIQKVYKAKTTDMGGSKMKGVLPDLVRSIGPFILFHHHGPFPMGARKDIYIPPHPHAGIETISYMFEGAGHHEDTLGFVQPLEAGRLNWMTTGSGIVHAEGLASSFTATGGNIHGLQIWTYLPEKQQQESPYFQTFANNELPVISQSEKTLVRVLAGNYEGNTAPVKLVRDLLLLDVRVAAGETLELAVPAGFEGGLYLCSGHVEVNGTEINSDGLSLNTRFSIRGLKDSILVLMAGEPLREPMFSYGPFVLSSREAVQQAIARFENGQMGVLKDRRDH